MIPAEDKNPEGTTLLIAVTRLEAKLDVALAQHGAKLETHDAKLEDHEKRLRVQEARPSVSPRVLWTTISGALGLILASTPFIDRIMN